MSKGNEQPNALRRSSRSTRGSVKPMVDLTKSELSEPEEDEPEILKANVADDDDEKSISSSDSEEYDCPRTTRGPKGKKQALPVKKKRQPTANSRRTDKTTKKGIKQGGRTTVEKSVAKSDDKKEDNIEDTRSEELEFHHELTEKEMKEINNAFDINCSDESEELLNSDDLRTAIRSLGFEPRADEIQNLMKKYSIKKNKISRESFHKIMAHKLGSSSNIKDNTLNDEISRVFNLLDLDKTGLITLENLRSISQELNEEITDEELHEMIVEADLDGDLQINRKEFYEIMKKTKLY